MLDYYFISAKRRLSLPILSTLTLSAAMPDPHEQDYSDSESSDHGAAGPTKPKRRRLHGACDVCRKKKSMSDPLRFLSED